MKPLDIKRVIKTYSFEKRLRTGKTERARRHIKNKFKTGSILLVGFGGTISSGYTPTRETIVPLFPSPAIKQIEYVNLFGTSNLRYDNIDVLAKDSRKITDEDMELLLDIIHLAPQKSVLITAGTYMLPKIGLCILSCFRGTSKTVALTGSILPAGFVASDADANIWSALSILNFAARDKQAEPKVMVVFHGRVFDTKEALAKLDLHPKRMKNLVIQYPLTTVPTNNVL